MRVGVDLRGLNFKPMTGVNSFTIRLLHQLYLLKLDHPDLQIIAIGLDKTRTQELINEYGFLGDLIDESFTLNEYLKLPIWLKNRKIQNLFLSAQVSFKTHEIPNYLNLNHLILVQPKPILEPQNCKLILCVHDLFALKNFHRNVFYEFLRENKRVYLNLMKSSDSILASSISTCLDILELDRSLESKLKLSYLALPKLSAFTKNNAKTAENLNHQTIDGQYILALSGVEPRKNWHNLLLAFAHWQKNNPQNQLKLVLAGAVVNRSYHKYLLKLAQKLSIKNLIWVYEPSQESKLELLENCLFLAYPSFYEGFGLPILEAFECGKTVLTSRVSSMPEVGREAVLYVNPMNYLEIAAGIEILVKDEKFRKRLETKAGQQNNDFNWEELGQNLKKTLDLS